MTRTVSKIDTIVAQFCAAVVAEPMCYFSEADLQAQLFVRLFTAFPKLVPTSVRRGPSSQGLFKTPLVHREYGAGGSRRVDLVLLGEKDLAKADRNLTDQGKYFTPEYAFELGTEKSGNAQFHITGDLKKLGGCRHRGYLVHFFRDTTTAAPGTKLRARADERIEKRFKAHAEKAKPPPNVRALFFVVRVARKEKRVRGRCHMYDPLLRKWLPVNTRDVESRVAQILSSDLPVTSADGRSRRNARQRSSL